MKFLFVIDEVDNLSSGIVSSTLSLAKELSTNGNKVTIVTGAARFNTLQVNENLIIIAFRCLNIYGFRIWLGFFRWFWMQRLRFQFISIESMWLPTNFIIFTIMRLFNLNLTIMLTPHGMLTKSSLSKSHKKKKAMLAIYKIFCKQISMIRAVSKNEAGLVSKFLPNVAVSVIPNAQPELTLDVDISINRRHMFIYLGRIDPIKRLEVLVDAYVEDIVNAHGPLHIYGPAPDNTEYFEELKNRNKSVKYLGPIFSNKKIELLKNSNVLVLASLDEGMPMVLLEALQCGCNILITQKLYSELFLFSDTAHKFIHTFDGSSEDLQDKLRILGENKYFDRRAAIDFVTECYSVNKITRDFLDLFHER